MRLSTKGRYAVTAMLDLTLNGTDGPVTLAEISETQVYRCLTLSNCLPPCGASNWLKACAGRVVAIIWGVKQMRYPSQTLSVRSTSGWSLPAVVEIAIVRMASVA